MGTLNEIFDKYERDVLPTLGFRTQKDYARHIKALRVTFGHMHPDAVQPKDIGAYLDVPRAKVQRNRAIAILSLIYTKAVGRWFVADRNPCLKVERNPTRPRDRYITDEEFKTIRSFVPVRVKLMMDLALETGQRQGDLLDLKWTEVHKEGILFKQSKTGKKLMVEMCPSLESILERCWALSAGSEYVISTKFGKPFSHEGFRALWQRYRQKLVSRGILAEDFPHFHDIRAKSASDDEDIMRASARLGHQNSEMTKSVYDRSVRRVKPLGKTL